MAIPKSYIKKDWQKVLIVLQKFITGETCYAFTYQYHVWLLLHFEEKLTLNFPFFFMKSLQKMSQQVQKNNKNPLMSLHHSGLIKILIFFELEKWHDSWVEFLKRNQFEAPIPTPKSTQKSPATAINEVTRLEGKKPLSPRSTDDAAQFVVKYQQGKKNDSAMTTSKKKWWGKKKKREDCSTPSEDQDVEQPSMAKTIPRRYTQSMARQKHQPAKSDRSEISPIEVEEDSSARPPDSSRPNSSPPTSPQKNQ